MSDRDLTDRLADCGDGCDCNATSHYECVCSGVEWPNRHLNLDALAEVRSLRRWKAEASQVIGEWERVWVAAGSPGPLGSSKAEQTRLAVERLAARYWCVECGGPIVGADVADRHTDPATGGDVHARCCPVCTRVAS